MIYFILDLDGVLVEYRYKDKINMTYEELIAPRAFLDRPPVDFFVESLNEMRKTGKVEYLVLSVSYTPETDAEKRLWVRRHIPYIPEGNIHFVRSADEKGPYLEGLYEGLKADHKILYHEKLDKKSVIMIDDTHTILYDVEARGFTAWHPTTWLNRYYHRIHLPLTSKYVV